MSEVERAAYGKVVVHVAGDHRERDEVAAMIEEMPKTSVRHRLDLAHALSVQLPIGDSYEAAAHIRQMPHVTRLEDVMIDDIHEASDD